MGVLGLEFLSQGQKKGTAKAKFLFGVRDESTPKFIGGTGQIQF